MRILIVVPKYEYSDEPHYNYAFPIGLGYISSTIKQAGYAVDCVNLNHERGGTKAILDRVLGRSHYDVVCTGGPCIHYHSLRAVICASRRNLPHSRIVVGGAIITSEPELMMASLEPDVAVVGEGEVTIVQLLQRMDAGEEVADLDGIVFKDSTGRIRVTRSRRVMDSIELVPYPDFDGFGYEEKLAHTHCNDHFGYSVFDDPRPYPLLGSRGCPFRCTFCWHAEKHRERSVPSIMAELDTAVERYRTNFVTLYDDCFAATKDRLTEFCDAMKELRGRTPWEIKWSCQLLVNVVTPSMLRTLKDAGCSMISYGFESYSKKVLKSMKKPISPEQIDKAFRETRDIGITIQGNFIFGDVAETPETVAETLDYWRKNCQGQVELTFVNPYPGSAIYQHCLAKGLIKDKLDFIQTKIASSSYNHFNMTDAMSDDEIQTLYVTLLDLHSQYVNYVRPRRIAAEKRGTNTYKMTVVCPFCGHENSYANVRIGNRLTYGFSVVCRYCAMKVVVVGILQGLARYRRLYRVLRRIRQSYVAVGRWAERWRATS